MEERSNLDQSFHEVASQYSAYISQKNPQNGQEVARWKQKVQNIKAS